MSKNTSILQKTINAFENREFRDKNTFFNVLLSEIINAPNQAMLAKTNEGSLFAFLVSLDKYSSLRCVALDAIFTSPDVDLNSPVIDRAGLGITPLNPARCYNDSKLINRILNHPNFDRGIEAGHNFVDPTLNDSAIALSLSDQDTDMIYAHPQDPQDPNQAATDALIAQILEEGQLLGDHA